MLAMDVLATALLCCSVQFVFIVPLCNPQLEISKLTFDIAGVAARNLRAALFQEADFIVFSGFVAQ